MAADDKHLHAGVNARPPESEPLFTEEAEEEARPVVPLAGTHDDATVVRPRRGRLPRNLALALAVVCAGAAGAAAGYLAHTQRAQEPAAEISVGEAPEQAPPALSNSPETSAAAPTVRMAQDKPQAQVEAERPGLIENERRGRDEWGRAGSIRKEEERLRKSEKKSAERLREQEKKIAERRSEEEKRTAEQRRDEEKGGKPKARLVGTLTGGRRPY